MKKLLLENDILKKGISLITLIITIVIVIILAVNKNNPINNVNEAVYRSDISQIQEQLNLCVTNEYIKDKNFNVSQLNGKVSDYIPNITKYDSELQVVGGKLRYIGDDITKKIAQNMNVETDVVTVDSLSYNKSNISYLPKATTKAIKCDASNN